jgi:hypothetical protein
MTQTSPSPTSKRVRYRRHEVPRGVVERHDVQQQEGEQEGVPQQCRDRDEEIRGVPGMRVRYKV